MVFTRNPDLLVAQIALSGISLRDETLDKVYLEVGAGLLWNELVTYCTKHNYTGIENLTLIPGTVGAAPIQNIGAYGVELKDVFVELSAVDQHSGVKRVFSKSDCQFGYRSSIFKKPAYRHYIICSLTLCLDKHFKPKLDYPSLAIQAERALGKTWQLEAKRKLITASMLSDWVRSIRQAKLPDPDKLPNAGSFFHNPVINVSHYQELRQEFADMPAYALPKDNEVKVPAAWLIEKAGWSGFKDSSGAGVHKKQALVLVNHDKATGHDIMKLAHKIQDSIWKQFAIRLSIEPVFGSSLRAYLISLHFSNTSFFAAL